MTDETGSNRKQRVDSSLNDTINAPADKIFKLCCPREELKWIQDWEYDLVYSDSGFNENNCMFYEMVSAEPFIMEALPTLWVTTCHDPVNRVIHFLLFTESKCVRRFELEFEESDNNTTKANWKMMFTSIDADGPGRPDTEIGAILQGMLRLLFSKLKYYSETGKMLKD